MFKYLPQCLRRLTLRQVVERDLSNAERELYEAQIASESADHSLAYRQARFNRLKALADALKQGGLL